MIWNWNYNPIEQVFAKLKAMLRKTQARTVDALWSAIGQLLERFGSAECEHYFATAAIASQGDSALVQFDAWTIRPVKHLGQGDEYGFDEADKRHLVLLVQAPIHQFGKLAFNKKAALAQATHQASY